MADQAKYLCGRHNKAATRACISPACDKPSLLCINCEQQHRHPLTQIVDFPTPLLTTLPDPKVTNTLQEFINQIDIQMATLKSDIQIRLDEILTEMFLIFDEILEKYRQTLLEIDATELAKRTGEEMRKHYIIAKNTDGIKEGKRPAGLIRQMLEYKAVFREIIPKLEDFTKTTQLFDFFKNTRRDQTGQSFSFANHNMKDISMRFEKIFELKGRDSTSPKYQELAKQLKQLNSSKQFAQVLVKSPTAIEQDPLSSSAYFEKGFALFDLGNLADAFVNYSISGDLGGNSSAAHTNRGICLIRMGLFESAVRCIEMALIIKKDYPNGLLNKGIAYQNMKRYDEALLFYDKATKAKPHFKIAQELYESLRSKYEANPVRTEESSSYSK